MCARKVLTDREIYNRAFHPPKSVEDTTFDRQRDEQLNRAIQQLPEIQRRRFVLYHEYGLTYEQIAMMDGCTFQAVALTVKAAEQKIKNIFEKWA